jgi:hypothetical protein
LKKEKENISAEKIRTHVIRGTVSPKRQQVNVRFLLYFFFSKLSSNTKKNVYPVPKLAAANYIIFNFCKFLSINNFVWRAFIKESSHLCCTKKLVWNRAKK